MQGRGELVLRLHVCILAHQELKPLFGGSPLHVVGVAPENIFDTSGAGLALVALKL
jgi:hypothetical protein